jgi:hypothetical protein
VVFSATYGKGYAGSGRGGLAGAVDRCGEEALGGLVLGDPVDDRGQRVQLVRALAAAAVCDAGQQEQPGEAAGGRRADHGLLYGLVVRHGAHGRDVLVAQAVPEDQLAAGLLIPSEGAPQPLRTASCSGARSAVVMVAGPPFRYTDCAVQACEKVFSAVKLLAGAPATMPSKSVG